MNKRRLKNIKIKSIALVDQGANLRDFAIYKRKDNTMDIDKKDKKDVDKKKEFLDSLGKVIDALKDENVEKAMTLANSLLKEMEDSKYPYPEKGDDGDKEYPVNKGACIETISKVVEMLKDGPNMNKISEAIGLLMDADMTLKNKLMDVDINNLETISKSVLDKVEKAGRKLSKSTLEKIQAAVKSLQDLLKEVDELKTDDDVKKLEKSMAGGDDNGDKDDKDDKNKDVNKSDKDDKGGDDDEEPTEEEQKEIEKMAMEIVKEELKEASA